jgi:protoporphyrinogen oxidase
MSTASHDTSRSTTIDSQSIDHVVIGAGLAGLSTALHYQALHYQALHNQSQPTHSASAMLDTPSLCIFESQNYVGGKARSEVINGFTFDVTGHWLHLRDDAMKHLVLKHCSLDHFTRIERKSRVWSHGVYTRYPFQANVYGLPPQVNYECVMGAIEATQQRTSDVDVSQEPENFADWVRFYFGEGIAKHFMVPYNAKLWGVPAEEITSAWCQRFVPRPQLSDIVAGAVGCHQEGMGYNATFLYPKQGGIQSVAHALADGIAPNTIRLEHAVQQIDPNRKIVTVINQGEFHYQRLVNTMPLPLLLDCMIDLPEAVQEARTQLRANEVIYLNVGIKGQLGQDDHWIYVPEERWPMYRVGSFSNACQSMAPAGCSSLYIELSDRVRPVSELMPEVIEGLIAMQMIQDPAQVLFAEVRRIPMAYVIYDFHYAQARACIHEWLAHHDILSTGRYGDWNYSSMEDALLDGRQAAHYLLK